MSNTNTMMDVLLLRDPEAALELARVAKPMISPSDALIRVAYVGICGSDLFHLSGKNQRANYPLIAGHEISGEIVELGGENANSPEGERYAVGDRVTIFPALSCGNCDQCKRGRFQLHRPLRMIGVQEAGGFAQYVRVPLENLVRIPDTLDLRTAALAEPFAVAVHGLKLAHPFPGESVLVIGAGPIGLMVASLARYAGCGPIIITERSAQRIQTARSMGFTCIDPQQEDLVALVGSMTRGAGVDMIFECVGHPSTIPQIIDSGAIRSRAVIVGAFHEGGAQIDLFAMSRKEQTMTVSWQYDIEDFATGLRILGAEGFSLAPLITHEIPLSMLPEALTMIRSGEAMKVLVQL